jgi:hypothetical protein
MKITLKGDKSIVVKGDKFHVDSRGYLHIDKDGARIATFSPVGWVGIEK